MPNQSEPARSLPPGRYLPRKCTGRQGIIESIEQLITEPHPVVVNLVGPRWIGKTSVLKCLHQPVQRNGVTVDDSIPPNELLYVYLDMAKLPDGANPFAAIAEKMSDELRAKPDLSLSSLLPALDRIPADTKLRPNMVESLLRDLSQIAASNRIRFVICIDHLDKLSDIETLNMRPLALLADSASLVLATRKTLTDISPDLAGSPLVHTAFVLSVGLLSESAASDLLIASGKGRDIQLTQEDIDLLIKFVGTHPYLLSRAGEQAHNLLLEGSTRNDRRLTVNDIRARIEPTLRPLFEGLWQEYGDLIERYERFQEKDESKVPEYRKRAIRQELQRATLIYEDPKTEFKFNYFSPLFESFVFQKLEQATHDQRHVARQSRTASQILEALELREGTKEAELLSLLVDNAGEIVPDVTLQTSVWGGAATDRTLVTTVNRLRAKMREAEQQIDGRIVRVRNTGYQFEWL